MAALGPEARKQMKRAGGLLALGIEMGLSVFVGIFGGQYLDKKFDTEPALALVGMLFGLAAGARAIVREVRGMKAASMKGQADTEETSDQAGTDQDHEP